MKSYILKIIVVIAGVISVLWLLDEQATNQASQQQAAPTKQVSVIEVIPSEQQATLKTSGLIQYHWQLDLLASVTGKLVKHIDSIQPGSLVKQGQLLAQIEDTQYAAELSSVNAEIAQAKLTLQEFQNQQTVVKKLEKNVKSNDFRLFKPHITAAKSQLNAAIAKQKLALKYLNDTKIIAPFDAVVMTKNIVPSQQINNGDLLFSLASSNSVDVAVSLSAKQWQKLANKTPITAEIKTADMQTWQAELDYILPQLNPNTRQRDLLLSIDTSAKDRQQMPLMADQQVDVTFNGQRISNTIISPASVLTRDNKVWTIEQGKLKLTSIELIEESDKKIVFTFIEQPEKTRQLVLYPLSSMLEGQSVQAKLVQQKEL